MINEQYSQPPTLPPASTTITFLQLHIQPNIKKMRKIFLMENISTMLIWYFIWSPYILLDIETSNANIAVYRDIWMLIKTIGQCVGTKITKSWFKLGKDVCLEVNMISHMEQETFSTSQEHEWRQKCIPFEDKIVHKVYCIRIAVI